MKKEITYPTTVEKTETVHVCDECRREIDGDPIRYSLGGDAANFGPKLEFCDGCFLELCEEHVDGDIEGEIDDVKVKTTRKKGQYGTKTNVTVETTETHRRPHPRAFLNQAYETIEEEMGVWLFTACSLVGLIPLVGTFFALLLGLVAEYEQAGKSLSYILYSVIWAGILYGVIGTVAALVLIALSLIGVTPS